MTVSATPVETRPTLGGLSAEQRQIALAHWHLAVFLCTRRLDGSDEQHVRCVLGVLEMGMQPETLHRLAMARGRFYQECDAQNKLVATSIDSRG